MKLETFFENFDRFADAPDAVAKMRELVLRLATSGRIAEQNPADQPGSELLKEISAVRDNLIKRGAAKSRIEGSRITAGDTIDLPPSWARCMISEVCDLQTGATPSRTEHSYFGGDTAWLVSGDINKGEITDCDGRITKEGLENSNCKIIPANSVLIALNGQGKTRATVAVLRIPAALNQSLVAMIPYSGERLLPEYVFWNLRGRYYAIRDITGQDQRRGLNMKLVGQLSLPIPPLAEQKRIVAKVDELMALCDQLEAQQQERETRHAALARASLARFADAPNSANLSFLFHSSYAIAPADLRKSILDLAVRGRLTGRDAKKESVASKYSDEPFGDALPANWRLLNFGRFCDIQGGNQPPKSQFSDEPKPGYVRMFQIRDLGHRPVPVYISRESTNRLCREGEILIGRYGASVGKVFWAQDGAYNVALAKFIFPEDAILPAFAFWVLKSDFFQAEIAGASRSAQAGFNKGDLATIDLPLPPLAEQRRIVAKVEQLMALVDALETQLAASRATAANLLTALVAELTGTN